MKRTPWLISLALALAFVGLYLYGLPGVPFHPDESSWLYMSRDFAGLITQGISPYLRPDQMDPGEDKTLLEYRWLNAPLPKYLIGLSWWLCGIAPGDLNTDWVWPQTWEENVAAGHLPPPGLLWAGRLPGAILSALAVTLLFRIVHEIRGLGAGLAAAVLLGLNPLVMLHGRRAMAEGVLLFFSLLAVWGLVHLIQIRLLRRRLARVGLLALAVGGLIGLAICSKQSALALLPAAAAAVILPVMRFCCAVSLRRRLAALCVVWLGLGTGSGLTFWALNPILYRDPLNGVRVMVAARADLARRQTQTQAAITPESVTPDPASRLRAALLEVYFRPPAVWDLPVYVNELAPQAAAYFAQPFQGSGGRLAWGALLAGLGVAGLAFSALRLWRSRLKESTWAEQAVWWWAAATISLTVLATPFDWQRYFIPLVPLACVFAALGLDMLARPAAKLISLRRFGKAAGAAVL